jgi:hypothetical protein
MSCRLSGAWGFNLKPLGQYWFTQAFESTKARSHLFKEKRGGGWVREERSWGEGGSCIEEGSQLRLR